MAPRQRKLLRATRARQCKITHCRERRLNFTKHTIKRWAEQFEQELNLKLFGRSSNRQYVELNLDGLLRGDFRTRMEGYASAIQHGVMTPNEARQAENRPDQEGGDALYMQGAMMPLDRLGEEPAATQGDSDEP